MPTPTTLSTNIRIAREAKGLTQLALAHKMGWHGVNAGAQICRFESGDKEPRISTVQRIADALEVSLQTLLMKPAK